MSLTRVDRGGWSLAATETGQGAGAPALVMSNSLGATHAHVGRASHVAVRALPCDPL